MITTPENYAANGGELCPICNSRKLEADRLSADGIYAWCNVVCHTCDAEWVDKYALVGYSELMEADNDNGIKG